MASTQNYDIPLPQFGEPADIRVIDQGTEMIDGIMHGNRTMVAPAWVSTETYNTGSRVVYLGEYYKCKEDGVTGAWDATKWDKTTVGEDIEGLGTGGASALADLDDVEITSPTQGQALLFDDDDDLWKNQTLPDPSVTKTATGNPIELTDAASAPIVKCVTEITGSQDLHGYDKPWVGGAGKNKLPMVLADIKSANTAGTWSGNAYTDNGVVFNVLTDNANNVVGISVKANSATVTTSFILCESFVLSQSCIMNGCPQGGGVNKYVLNWQTNANDTGEGIYITTPSIGNVRIQVVSGASIYDTFYPMIRLSTVTDPTFAPYSNICPITAYTEGEIEVRASANLLNENASDILDKKTILSDSSIINAEFVCVSGYIPVIPNLPITYGSFENSTTSGGVNNEFNKRIVCFDENKQFIATLVETTVASYKPFSISGIIPSNCAYVRVPFYRTKSIMMLNYGTTLLPYQAYSEPTTHTTTYPSAIYRGSEDVVNGKYRKIQVVKVFDGTETWNTEYDYNFYTSSGKEPGNPEFGTLISSHMTYQGITGSSVDTSKMPSCYIAVSGNLNVQMSNIAHTGAAMKAWCLEQYQNGTPFTIVYTVDNPTDEDIAITNLPIRTLSGYNHIESSTGEMEVEYISGNYQALVDLIQSSSHVYSTAEQIVGKWTDGRNVYEKSWEFDSYVNVAANSIASLASKGVTISDVDFFVKGVCISRVDKRVHFPFGVGIYDNAIGIQNVSSGSMAIDKVVLQYVKAANANRSVSLQKSISEPLTDKTEEVPTEEEKAVETPETEEENDER